MKEARKNRIWRYVTNVLAVLVVFVTTYMLILPGITLTITDYASLEITDIEYDSVVYENGDYTTTMTLTFAGVSVSDVLDNNYTYELVLPEYVVVDSSLMGGELKGYDGTTQAFTYQYYYDDTTGRYYAIVVFDTDYIASYSSTATLNDGYIEFDASFSSSSVQEDGSIVCSYNESDELTIPVSKITTADSSYTPNADISVSKSSSGYDASTNSITYTVTVYSESGTTSDISLEDVIAFANSNFTVSSVNVDSVTYAAKSDAWNYGTSSEVDSSSYSYAYDSTTGTLSMTLPALAETDNGSKYTVTYTVYLNTFTDYSLSDTVNNTVKASATDTWNGSTTIYDTASEATAVSISLLSKSGSFDSSTGEITWTLTVNASGMDIYGMTLTDEMFDGLTAEDLTVTVSGSGGRGNGYEFSYDSNGDLYITFGSVSGVASNTSTYTFTYTTGSGLTLGNTSNGWVENDASIYDSNGNTVVSGSESVYVYGGGSATKSLEDSTDNSDGTVTAEWSVSFSIPSGGITSGTVLYDYLSSKDDYTSTTDQYFTYVQAMTIVNAYAYSINISNSSGSTLKTISNSDYTMAFYDQTTGGWVDYEKLNSGSNTYSEDKFTAFRLTFGSDVTLTASGTITLSYKSTIDVSAASTTSDTYYYNRVYVNDSEFAKASYKNSANVTKMNDSGSTSDSTLTTTTGQVAWKVRIYVDEGSTETFTIVDTLPEGMELSAIYINTSDYYSSAMTIDGTTITGTLDDEVTGTITTDSDGNQVITLVVDADAYASVSAMDGGGYIWIRYVTQMSDTLMTLGEGVTSATYELTNEVSVTKGTEVYGTSSQTQTVTYGSSSSSSDSEEVAKGYSWDYYNSEISYYVVLNPSAEDLLAGLDTLTFTDVVNANFLEDWGLYLSLLSDSVHVYKAVAVTEETDTTNLTVYTGGDGNSYIVGDEITVESLTYSQVTTWTTAVTGTTTHTISGTVPDETAMIVVYSYYVNVVGSGGTLQSLYNKASLYGDSEYSYTKYTQESYLETNASAGIFGSESLTLTKVDSTNLNTTLSGAVYELYWYTNGAWADTGLSFTTKDDGSFSITKSMLGDYYAVNTAYKLIETDAPDGYILDSSTEWDFYWYDSSTSATSYPDGFTTQDDVYNLSLVSAQIVAPNTIAVSTTTSVKVEKDWVDTDGNELADSEIDASEIELTLYRYEESDVAEEESETETETEDAETIVINIWYNSNDTGEDIKVNKGETVTLTIDAGADNTLNSWYLADTSWGYKTQDTSISGSTSCEATISSSYTTEDLIFNISGSVSYNSWAGTVAIKGDSTTISGVNSSGLPHDSNDDYAGTAIGTYTVTATNSWSLTVDDLLYEYYDNIGEKHTYYYYFVETAIDGYYTTYSSSTGVTDGGTFTVTNTKIPTTSIEVEKRWLDTDGSELTSGDTGYTYITKSISVDLYRTEEVVDGSESSDSDTVSLSVRYASWYGDSSYTTLAEEDSIPAGTSVTVDFGYAYIQYGLTGYINGDQTSFSDNSYTFVIDADTIIVLTDSYVGAYSGSTISYSGQGLSGSSTTTYSGADLPTDGTYVGTYTIEPDADGNWNLSISNLSGGYVDDEGTLHNYYYYVRESSDDLLYFDTTYSSSSAISDGTLIIYNTYNPDLEYTEARVEKIWLDSTSTEISDLSSYSATFQLIQVLQVADDSTSSGYVETDGSILMIPYRSPMTLTDSSSSWAGRWVNLPTTASYGGETYNCIYFIIETDATDGTDTTTFTVAASTSTESGSDSYTTITVDGVTYYAVTVGNTSVELLSSSYVPTVKITNTSSEEEEEETTISFTVTKNWLEDGSSFAIAQATVTVQLLQVLTADGEDTLYNQSSSSDIAYTKTMTFTGSSAETVSWTELPATMTVDSVEYTCTYYIVEAAVLNGTDGSGTSIADQYTASYAIDGTDAESYEYSYTDSESTVTATYYAVSDGNTITITNTKKDSVTLPMTGGLGNKSMTVFLGSSAVLLAFALIIARRRKRGGGQLE